MEKVNTQSYKVMHLYVISFVLIFGGLMYSNAVKADTVPIKPPGEQLAYFIGYHTNNGPNYYHHHHHRKLYWTGWRYVGHGCRKSCLVDRWSGRVVRCNRVCN